MLIEEKKNVKEKTTKKRNAILAGAGTLLVAAGGITAALYLDADYDYFPEKDKLYARIERRFEKTAKNIEKGKYQELSANAYAKENENGQWNLVIDEIVEIYSSCSGSYNLDTFVPGSDYSEICKILQAIALEDSLHATEEYALGALKYLSEEYPFYGFDDESAEELISAYYTACLCDGYFNTVPEYEHGFPECYPDYLYAMIAEDTMDIAFQNSAAEVSAYWLPLYYGNGNQEKLAEADFYLSFLGMEKYQQAADFYDEEAEKAELQKEIESQADADFESAYESIEASLADEMQESIQESVQESLKEERASLEEEFYEKAKETEDDYESEYRESVRN